jgi:flagellar basal-body rod protein FlgB
MAITDLSVFSMLRTRMSWHQERQRLLAENVANADTPKFRPRDLDQPNFDKPMAQVASLALRRTESGHFTGAFGGGTGFAAGRASGYEIRPSGNAVNLEDEMLKVASNQMDYQAATTLYTRSLGLLKTALGKR